LPVLFHDSSQFTQHSHTIALNEQEMASLSGYHWEKEWDPTSTRVFSYQHELLLGRCGDAPRLQEEEGAQDSGGAQIFHFYFYTHHSHVLFCLQLVSNTASLVTTVLILRSPLVASEHSQGSPDHAPT